MEQQAANARWARLHEDRQWHDGTFRNWAERPSPEYPIHRDHGLTIGVAETDLRPADKFLTHVSWGLDQTEDSGASAAVEESPDAEDHGDDHQRPERERHEDPQL